MRLVVDTNILFSFFWKESVTQELLLQGGLELFSPEYALEEIGRHEEELRRKARLSSEEFRSVRKELAVAVAFVALDEYEGLLRKAAELSPDPNDADFFALALLLEVPLWSNDALLGRQDGLRVLSTKELLSDSEFLQSI